MSSFESETILKFYNLGAWPHTAVQDYIEQESIENIDWSFRSLDFPIGIMGQACCLIVSIPDLCPLSYFISKSTCGHCLSAGFG